MKKRGLVSLFIAAFIFLLSANLTHAYADDLVIMDNGQIVLVVPADSVLGTTKAATTTAPIQSNTQSNQNSNQNKPQADNKSPSSTNSAPPPPTKTVPLVPAHSQSMITVTPSTNNDKKVQVTITTTKPPVPTSSPPKAATTQKLSSLAPVVVNPTTSNQLPNTPTVNKITKTVDRVVAESNNGQPVFTIQSSEPSQLTIKQGQTQASTTLPLQVDTTTHSLRVTTTTNESTRVSVLPNEALQAVIDKELFNTESINQAKMNLTNDQSGINYTVQTEKKGKLFGVFPVQSPVEVKLSAQTGKVVNTSQSLLFSLLGGFIH